MTPWHASLSVVYVKGNTRARQTADWLSDLPDCYGSGDGVCHLAVRSRRSSQTFYLIARRESGRS